MSLVSIRLPDEVETRLAREAERTQRPKSEVARDAIVDYLARLERARFLSDIARAARSRGTDEALAMAQEALPLDNEALALGEKQVRAAASVREAPTKYHVKRKRR